LQWIAKRADQGLPLSGVQGHPLYRIWWERKCRGGLCEAWNDFRQFAADIGERPSSRHYLARRVPHEAYSPDNWVWKEHIRREPDETDKAFYARKWQAQKARRPDFDKRRHLVRDFGITEEIYEAMFAAQDGKCAICGREESAIDHKRKAPKSLSVDHCHKTGVVRDLLCWTCNSTLGKIQESKTWLEAMISYLEKWEDPHAAAKAAGRPEKVEPRPHEIMLETEWGTMCASDAARRVGLAPHTVLGRIRRGWPLHRVLIARQR
jgi:hypothetical protein